jgi:hypothetical protein
MSLIYGVGYGGGLSFYDGVNFYSASYCLPGTWDQVGFVYDGGTSVTIYCNGVAAAHYPGTVNPQSLTGPLSMTPSASISQIGAYPTASYYFRNNMSNVQLYNTSLSASEVASLYSEGIGGAPLPMPGLVGWWPLNGDVNDYSGNNNGGTSTNVFMSSSWTAAYSPP